MSGRAGAVKAASGPSTRGPAKGAPGDSGIGRTAAVVFLLIALLGGGLLAAIIRGRLRAEGLLAEESRLAAQDVDRIAARRSVYVDDHLPRQTTFSQFLERAGLDGSTVQEIVDETRPVYNLGRVRAGNRVTLIRSGKGDLRAIRYEIDSDRALWIKRDTEGFHAEVKAIPYVLSVAGVKGEIQDSLFQAVTDQGEGDQLALEIADIFGWDIDFSTDPRQGDTFEVLVEKKMLRGEFLGYGRILAAEYRNEGKLFQAVLFRDPSGRPAYYAPSGKSMKKAFLRSPLRFGAVVTSRFSYHRFHPILKRYRPHLGIDYGAPVGSAVQAVADGRVVSAGWHGGGGKEIRLRHAMGYETYYLHLSRILVRPGQRVQQGQIIGRTGATGLATGPHLDFRIRQHGQFRNFLALKLPPARSVSRQDWPEFEATRTQLLGELASLHDQQAGVAQAILHNPDQDIPKGK
jgi:murein DD-endopeptidase MepM/ murein hydrolase activator NlpD